MTCLNPNNFRFNTSVETYNISFESRDRDISNAIIPTSITGLVVEVQQTKKGALKITNQSHAMIQLV
jgi:hypothetical protein